MIKILITAYDINPYKGSEASTGWNFTIQVTRENKVVAITRKNNKQNIEKYIKENNISTENLEFKYYDLPYWMRFWKKGSRGSSLYFYLWQMFMPIFILKNKLKFDIAHNVNFHADAFPTFLWLLRKPLIWGPINHNELIPKQYFLSKKEAYKDSLKWIIKNINWKSDPFIFLSRKLSDIVIGGNSSVKKRLNISEKRFYSLSQVASNNVEENIKNFYNENFTILLVGRFITIKSFDLSLKSFEKFYNSLSDENQSKVFLKIIGDGPLKHHYQSIIKNFNSIKNIEFCGWIEKNMMDNYYKTSSVFFFSSHEGAGMVIAEALSFGLPIVCFDNYGPGELTNDKCAIRIPYSNYDKSIEDFSKALVKIYEDKELLQNMSLEARKLFEEKYTWEAKGREINSLYLKLKEKYKIKDSK